MVRQSLIVARWRRIRNAASLCGKRATPVGYQQPPRGTSISRWMSTTLSCVSVGSQVLFCAFCGGGPGQATGSFPGTGVEPTLFAVSTIRAW